MTARTATGAISNDTSIAGNSSSSDSTIDAQMNLTAAGGISNVTANLSGSGNYLEFGGFVSGDETVDIFGSSVVIDEPKEFHGTVDLHDSSLADLVGLAQADSWSYANDLLTMTNHGGHVVDTLHVISDATNPGGIHGLEVSKVGHDLHIIPGTDFSGSFGSHTT